MGGFFGTIGKALSNDAKAMAYIERGGRNATRLSRKAYNKIAPAGKIGSAYSDVMGAAASLRQQQLGQRAVGLGIGVAGASSVGGGSRKSYYNPIPTPKGSGRFP